MGIWREAGIACPATAGLRREDHEEREGGSILAGGDEGGE